MHQCSFPSLSFTFSYSCCSSSRALCMIGKWLPFSYIPTEGSLCPRQALNSQSYCLYAQSTVGMFSCQFQFLCHLALCETKKDKNQTWWQMPILSVLWSYDARGRKIRSLRKLRSLGCLGSCLRHTQTHHHPTTDKIRIQKG